MENENTLKFATAYLQTWIDAMGNDAIQMPVSWHKAHQWTVAHMANILYPLAVKLAYGENNYGINVQQEYYRVDFSLYTYYEQSTWTLDYAIEHENAEFVLNDDETIRKKGWFDEFAKLLPLKCAKSRVVICYDTFDDTFPAKLKKCSNLLNDSRIKASVADSPVLLIILPYTNYIKSENYESGLVHIIEFMQEDATWEMKDLTEKVLSDRNIEKGLKNAFVKIAATSKR